MHFYSGPSMHLLSGVDTIAVSVSDDIEALLAIAFSSDLTLTPAVFEVARGHKLVAAAIAPLVDEALRSDARQPAELRSHCLEHITSFDQLFAISAL
jgi:hypothetical protein